MFAQMRTNKDGNATGLPIPPEGEFPPNLVQWFKIIRDHLVESLDCERCEDTEQVRATLKVMREEIKTSTRQGEQLADEGEVRHLCRL